MKYFSHLLLIISFPLFSQFNELKYDLSSKKITNSLVDSYGLEWIATEEGLNMYDGVKVHRFESILSDENSLLNSNIDRIRELENGDLLFLSKDGISFFNRTTFNFRRIKVPFPITLLVDSFSKEFFVTTALNGVYILDFNYNIKDKYISDPLNPFSISTNVFEKSGAQKTAKVLNNFGDVIFSVGEGFNVYQAKKKNFKRYISEFDYGSKINVLSKLDQNKILIGTNSGLKIFDFVIDSLNNFDTDYNFFSKQTILDIVSYKLENDFNDDLDSEIDSSNISSYLSFILTEVGLYKVSLSDDLNILNFLKLNDNLSLGLNRISTSDKGFHLWGVNKKKIFSYDKFGNILSSQNSEFGLSNLCINNQQELLLSTPNGLYTSKVDPVFVKFKGLFKDLQNYTNFSGFVLRFYDWKDDDNWIIIDHNTLRVSLKGNVKELRLKKLFSQKNIDQLNSSLIKLKDNRLFFIDKSLLTIVNLIDFSFNKILIPNKIRFNKLRLLDDKAYLSFENGILVYNYLDEQFNLFEYDELFNKDFPRGFSDVEKVGNQIWVSNSLSGLHVFENDLSSNPELFSSDKKDNNRISSFSVNKIHYDKKTGFALISTMGDGLFLYSLKDSIFKQYTKADGLLSNNVIDSKYGKNYIWSLTNKGINFFREGDNFIFEIDETNGFQSILFDDDPLRISSTDSKNNDEYDDEFFIETSESYEILDIVGSDYIKYFNSKDIIKDDSSFNLELLNLKVFNYSQDFFYQELKGNMLNIDSSTDFIELELFSNNKLKRDQVEYFYSSNTTNGSFVSNGNNNVIRIQSIPNYKSEVKIKAINKSGLESSNILSFTISKTPPWFQRTESLIAYVLILFISIFFYSKWREKSAFKKLEEQRMNKELEEARKLQNSLLPKKIPTRKEYDISVYLKSATEVGGDYYDFIENKNNDLYAICGDATGHGVVSGIMVSVTKAGLNGIQMADPSTILNNLNSIVKRVNFGRLRMSLSVAKINNGSIELSSAAMPPTYYYSAKNKIVEEILVPNLPLGGIEGEKFDGVKKDFKKGDVVVMISDGLPELPNKEDILLDYPKVLECIKNNCNESADGIKDALVDMSEAWADGLMNPDDITIVVIKKAS